MLEWNEFEIESITYENQKPVAYEVRMQGRLYKLTKDECFALFKKQELRDGVLYSYQCVNAVLVKGKYIRSKLKRRIRGIVSNCPIPHVQYSQELPIETKTYRYLFPVLKNRIREWRFTPPVSKSCVRAYAVCGNDGIGKTTLLKQLYNAYANAVYIDGNAFDGNLYHFLHSLYEASVRFVFIDNLCSLNEDDRRAVVSFLRNGIADIFFILADSDSAVVSEMAADILVCHVYNLPSVMYIERLVWEHSTLSGKVLRYSEALLLSEYAMFLKWLKEEEIIDLAKLFPIRTEETAIDVLTEYCIAKLSDYYYHLADNSYFTLNPHVLGMIDISIFFGKHWSVIKVGNTVDAEIPDSIKMVINDFHLKEVIYACSDTEFEENVTYIEEQEQHDLPDTEPDEIYDISETKNTEAVTVCKMRADILVLLLEYAIIMRDFRKDSDSNLAYPSLCELYYEYIADRLDDYF